MTALLLSAIAVGTAPLPVFAQSYRFSNVTIEGNQRIEPRTILNHARIPRGQGVSAAELNDAYQRLSNSGLFESVNLVPRGGTLVIEVKELPSINAVSFEGNRRMKAERLAEMVDSRSRRIYSPATAEADAAKIAEAYAQQGRLAARVEPRIIRRSGNRVDLVFEIAEGRNVEIERLSFVGNRNFNDRRLRQVLETKQAGLLRQIIGRDTYVAERVDIDRQLLKDFYLSRGYVDFQVLDATAELARERDGFFVTFTVREGLQYRFGETRVISEIEGVDAAEYQSLIRVRNGSTYSPGDVDAAIARMESLASRKGVNFLRVEPRIKRNDREQILDVDFALVRGERVFVERIDIEGNTTTMDQVIRRQFRTVEGDPLNGREVREAAERIRALGYFGDADVEASEGSTPESVIVKARVEEKPTGSLSFGATYGKSDGVGLVVNLSESNFLGRGQYVGVNLNIGSSNTESNITFSEPAVLGRDLKFTFDAQYKETEANYAPWDSRLAQLSLSLEFPLSETVRIAGSYIINRSGLTFPGVGLTTPPPASPILTAESGRGSLIGSGLGYQLTYDSRRTGLIERTAYVARVGQTFYGLGGDLRYVKTEAFAGLQHSILNGEVNLRAEVEAGAIHSSGAGVRATERFFLGGKVRGFQPFGVGPQQNGNPLGGNYYFAARAEADFPVGLPEEYGVRGGVFLDVGSVWGLDSTAGGVVGDSMKLRAAVGLSLLWDTPIGPLRFNFSRPLRKEAYDKPQNFDLTISTKF